MTEQATFSLFVRKLPQDRNYLIACGLNDLVSEIESISFNDEIIEYLQKIGSFSEKYLNWLRAFKFSGSIFAIPEGMPFFADEPILEITAPIAEAQLIETLVVNQIGFQTIIASKAARIVIAAQGKPVVDYGARRAQGFDAAIKSARAAYICGIESTSNVLSNYEYGIPLSGTCAHSFIEAHSSESEAFENIFKLYSHASLLVDTYNSIEGVKRAINIAKRNNYSELFAIRLDSGNICNLAFCARKILNESGFEKTKIIASNSLDEYSISELREKDTPIDIFGVGTKMVVSADQPYLDIVYKLVDYANEGRMKISPDKSNLPGKKQIYRQYVDKKIYIDVISLREEILEGVPLLKQVMDNGKRLVENLPSLRDVRKYCIEMQGTLPTEYYNLLTTERRHQIKLSKKLELYNQEISNKIRSREIDQKI